MKGFTMNVKGVNLGNCLFLPGWTKKKTPGKLSVALTGK